MTAHGDGVRVVKAVVPMGVSEELHSEGVFSLMSGMSLAQRICFFPKGACCKACKYLIPAFSFDLSHAIAKSLFCMPTHQYSHLGKYV